MNTRLRFDGPHKLAIGGGALGALMVVAYVLIVTNEGNNPTSQIVTWSIIMGVPCVLALASVALPAAISRWTLMAATILFGGLVMLTALGPGFLVSAALTGTAAYKINAALTPIHS